MLGSEKQRLYELGQEAKQRGATLLKTYRTKDSLIAVVKESDNTTKEIIISQYKIISKSI